MKTVSPSRAKTPNTGQFLTLALEMKNASVAMPKTGISRYETWLETIKDAPCVAGAPLTTTFSPAIRQAPAYQVRVTARRAPWPNEAAIKNGITSAVVNATRPAIRIPARMGEALGVRSSRSFQAP